MSRPLSACLPLWFTSLCLVCLPARAAEHEPAAHPPAKASASAAAPMSEGQAMDKLRARLAERLGAVKPADTGGGEVLRVVNKTGKVAAEFEPDQVIHSGQAAPARKPAAHASTQTPAKTPSAPAAPTQPAAALAAAYRAGLPAEHADGAAAHALHWDYTGEAGPQAWGELKPEFKACSSGQRQSPIDIRDGIQVQLEAIQFDYRPSSFTVIDNGHTVQVNLAPGNSISVGGRRYDLLQFHFHRPSEERINGRQFDMVAHLVHKGPEGRLAVVAVLLDRGSAQPIVQAVWNALPLEKNIEVPAPVAINLNQLLPDDKRYYTYMGSLTTPPCSEGVLWMVMKQPVPIAPEQVNIFTRLYPMNARPIQQAAGRLIKESN
jgi:carbonic anhydrase